MKRPLFAILIAVLLLINTPSQTRDVQGRVFWKGTVDARVQLVIKGDQIETKTLDGRSYPDGTYSFTSPLPSSPVTVGVNRTEGRGSATVTQQPTEDNDFKAIVEVIDSKGGAREYQLEIFWQ